MKGEIQRSRMLWTFVATSLALVMVTLDNLVVTTALPVIREDLHASLEGLEWTVNAYTLTFAVLLLTGAALAPSMGVLVAAISSARGSSHACTSRRGLRLRPAAG
jgi:MFS family permease